MPSFINLRCLFCGNQSKVQKYYWAILSQLLNAVHSELARLLQATIFLPAKFIIRRPSAPCGGFLYNVFFQLRFSKTKLHSTTSTTDTSTTDLTRIMNAMATSSNYLMKYFNGKGSNDLNRNNAPLEANFQKKSHGE